MFDLFVCVQALMRGYIYRPTTEQIEIICIIHTNIYTLHEYGQTYARKHTHVHARSHSPHIHTYIIHTHTRVHERMDALAHMGTYAD